MRYILLSLCFYLGLIGCSVYKSEGRLCIEKGCDILFTASSLGTPSLRAQESEKPLSLRCFRSARPGNGTSLYFSIADTKNFLQWLQRRVDTNPQDFSLTLVRQEARQDEWLVCQSPPISAPQIEERLPGLLRQASKEMEKL